MQKRDEFIASYLTFWEKMIDCKRLNRTPIRKNIYEFQIWKRRQNKKEKRIDKQNKN